MAVADATILNVVVNEPGQSTPVSGDIVEEALYQSLQDDSTTTVTNLRLAVVNTPTVSNTQRENAITVQLKNTVANEVRFLFIFSPKPSRNSFPKSLQISRNVWLIIPSLQLDMFRSWNYFYFNSMHCHLIEITLRAK